MQLPGGWEWIIILIIVLLVFGPSRLSRLAGEIGKGIREFRSGLRGDDDGASEGEEPASEDPPE
jgi:sec-independent protein translocase protein TatA